MVRPRPSHKINPPMNWDQHYQSLTDKGYATIPAFFTPQECIAFREMYDKDKLYRSVISMQRYRFGQGEYKYFAYPLPEMLERFRKSLYQHLAPLANAWAKNIGGAIEYPDDHDSFLRICHANGQQRPTPLILRYVAGGYNTLHQDIYGEIYFPFQVVIMLAEPGLDFEGGEFVMVEQIPRAQSKANVIRLRLGDALIFTTSFRPAKGKRGFYKVTMKHGISEVTRGERYALGIILHDAR
jgi:uncharacterized protein